MIEIKETPVLLTDVVFYERPEMRNHASLNKGVTIFGKGKDKDNKTVDICIEDKDLEAVKITREYDGKIAKDEKGKPLIEKKGNVNDILNRKYMVSVDGKFVGAGDLYTEYVQKKCAREKMLQNRRSL